MQSKKIIRNNTSFPLQITAKLKEYFNEYTNSNENIWNKLLKYYQYLVKELISSPNFTENEYARGLLIYHTMGMGKTRLAVAVAMACWNTHSPVVLLPQSLKKNLKKTIEEVVEIMEKRSSIEPFEDKKKIEEDLKSAKENAVKRFNVISMDAYNSAHQMLNIGIPSKANTLSSKANTLSSKKLSKANTLSFKKSINSNVNSNFTLNQIDSIIGGSTFSSNGLDNKL